MRVLRVECLTRFSSSLRPNAALHVSACSRVSNCLFYQMQQLALKIGSAIANSGLAISCLAAIFFKIDLLFHVITDAMWDTYKHLFKDGGLEIYEKAGQDYTKEVVFTEVGAPAKRLEARRLEASFFLVEFKIFALKERAVYP